MSIIPYIVEKWKRVLYILWFLWCGGGFSVDSILESPEKVDYQLFSPFIANEAKQKYKKQAIIFFKGQIISEFYQRLNTHLPQNM